MANYDKKRIPVREGLWTTDREPRLAGSRCKCCGEVFFPRKQICVNCQCQKLEKIKLKRKGKIYSYTIVMQRPPMWYKGPVPYAIGYVELPERVKIETLFTDCEFQALKIGMDVELVIEKLHEDDEGNEIMAYKFKPIGQT